MTPRVSSRSGSLEIGLSSEIETGVQPYSRLRILRSIDASPASSLSPAGIAGTLKVVIINISPTRGDDATDGGGKVGGDLTRQLDYRYCILLDGIFTFLPNSVFVATGGESLKSSGESRQSKTRAVGSMENRSIFLSGYVIRKADEKTISLKGSKGESTAYLLEASSVDECQRWFNVLNVHVEHVDNKAGSKWIF